MAVSEKNHEINFNILTPAKIVQAVIDKKIPAMAQTLYGIIQNLCHEKGYCFATDGYLAEVLKVTPRTIQRWLEALSEQGFIHIEHESTRYTATRKIIAVVTPKKSQPKDTVPNEKPAMSYRYDKNVRHNIYILKEPPYIPPVRGIYSPKRGKAATQTPRQRYPERFLPQKKSAVDQKPLTIDQLITEKEERFIFVEELCNQFSEKPITYLKTQELCQLYDHWKKIRIKALRC